MPETMCNGIITPPGGAVIHEHAWLRSLESKNNLLPRVDQRELAAAQGACGRVKVDVVLQRIRFGIHERELDVVVLVHHYDRAWHASVECQGPDLGPSGVDLDQFLYDFHADLDNLGVTVRHLFGLRKKWRGHERLCNPPQPLGAA